MNLISIQNDLIIEMPRKRKQTARYGNQDSILDMSELDTSDTDYEEGDDVGGTGTRGKGKRNKKKEEKEEKRRTGRRGRRPRDEEVDGDNVDVPTGTYTRSEYFKVEKHLLVYG